MKRAKTKSEALAISLQVPNLQAADLQIDNLQNLSLQTREREPEKSNLQMHNPPSPKFTNLKPPTLSSKALRHSRTKPIRIQNLQIPQQDSVTATRGQRKVSQRGHWHFLRGLQLRQIEPKASSVFERSPGAIAGDNRSLQTVETESHKDCLNIWCMCIHICGYIFMLSKTLASLATHRTPMNLLFRDDSFHLQYHCLLNPIQHVAIHLAIHLCRHSRSRSTDKLRNPGSELEVRNLHKPCKYVCGIVWSATPQGPRGKVLHEARGPYSNVVLPETMTVR